MASGEDGQELSSSGGTRSPKAASAGGGGGESTASSPARKGAGTSGGGENATSASGGQAPSPGLPSVAHPCLHAGYAKPYKRLRVDGRGPHPSEVLLLGR